MYPSDRLAPSRTIHADSEGTIESDLPLLLLMLIGVETHGGVHILLCIFYVVHAVKVEGGWKQHIGEEVKNKSKQRSLTVSSASPLGNT